MLRQMSSDPSKFIAQLKVYPQSRCVALSLPHDALAILPLYQSQIDLDLMDVDQTMARYARLKSADSELLADQMKGDTLLSELCLGFNDRSRSKNTPCYRLRISSWF